MRLFGSLTSPYVRKARVLIHEKQLPVELVVEDPWSEDSPIIEKNPLSKVPVLEIAPEQYYFESSLVVHFLDHVDGKSLTPTDPQNYWQAQWWQALGNGIIDAAIQRIFETRRPQEHQLQDRMEREAQRIRRAIALAEKTFAGGDFLLANRFTLADLVLGVALQYVDFRYPHDWRASSPKLAQWHAGIASRRSFEETVPPGFLPPHTQ
jgi:glutathione S-transferase